MSLMQSFARGVLVVLIACSNNSPENVDAPGRTGSAACADEAAAHSCSLRGSCSSNFNIEKNFPDEATCVSRTAMVCENDLSAPDTGQTPSKIEACAAQYPSEACVDYFEGNPTAACVPPMGSGATGAPCGVSAQCASTYCAISQYQDLRDVRAATHGRCDVSGRCRLRARLDVRDAGQCVLRHVRRVRRQR